jgi:hypothetical protein
LTAAVLGVVVAGPVFADNQGGGGIPVVPVYGKALGNGLRLYVDVFYARGGNPGPPGSGGGGGSVNCTDTNQVTDYTQPFASASNAPLTLHLNQGTVPGGLNAGAALTAAEGAWNTAGSGTQLNLATDGTETTPVQNGTSTIGWVKIVPKNVLAATWTYVDSTNHIIEADLFFNNTYAWTSFTSCPTTATGMFDVGDIATHEMGHVLGLSHVSDAGAQSTMYPSAPSDEVRKTTLTAGDKTALGISVSG